MTEYRHAIDPWALDHVRAAYAYQDMPHNPYDFRVVRSYRAFERELLVQFADVSERFGIVWHDGSQDYESSGHLFAHLDQGWMRTRHTGESGDLDDMPADHPMRHATGLKVNGVDLTLNDVFRAVHDVYGHYAVRASFGPEGEMKAWLAHRSTLSREALPALWCETRGQASWLNDYADHRSRPLSERPFAAQKSGMPPSWAV